MSNALSKKDRKFPDLGSTMTSNPNSPQHIKQTLYQGPIPKGDELAIYGDINPELPIMIVAMADRQAAHRQACENRQFDLQQSIITGEHKREERGQYLGIVSILIIAVLSGYGFSKGFEEEASSLAKYLIASVAGIFVLGKIPFFNKVSKEESDK